MLETTTNINKNILVIYGITGGYPAFNKKYVIGTTINQIVPFVILINLIFPVACIANTRGKI